jgi:hypothetical protein
MGKKSKSHTIPVILKLPKKVPDFIFVAQMVHDTIEAHPSTLPTPSPPLVLLQAHISDLMTKQSAAASRSIHDLDARDIAHNLVAVDLNNERAYVAQVVNASPGDAAVIVAHAGMSLRKTPSFIRPILALKRGINSGMLHAIAKAVPGAKAYEWEYSLDGGTTWLYLPPTTQAKTTVQNLTPGIKVWFHFRALTKAGLGDWSDRVWILVT